MANLIKDEILRATVQINADPARSEMQKLERSVVDLKSQKETLVAAQRKLKAENKEGTQAWLDNAAAIKQANAQLKEERQRLAELGGQLKISTMSISELKKEKQRLSAVRVQYGPNTQEFQEAKSRLQEIENRLKELNVRAETASSGFSKFSSFMNRNLAAMGAVAGAAAGIFATTNNAVTAYAEIDDKMSDVMKTTGLAKDEVIEMNAELAEIDTRSAQMQLLGLAVQAGKLGISGREDVAAFVKAADQISVALGEDLGGEEAINHIGKLVDIFKIKEEFGMAEGMIKAGSAINSLGASSTANEQYLVDFAKRMGGMGSAANMTLPDILGLGSTLDALGQRTESASTAVGRMVSGMFAKTGEYAKVAGMQVKEFSDLLNSAPNEALKKVLEGVSGNDAGLERILKMLAEVGINSTEAKAVISSLSQNIGLLTEQQALSNAEFDKGTSLFEEFTTKNDNAQARIEKAQKLYQQRLVEIGQALEPVRASMFSSASLILKFLGFLIEYKAVIISITVASLGYVAAAKLKVFWSQANRVAMVAELATMGAATTGTKLLAAAKLLLAGNLRAAGMAFKMFFASIGPLGWLALAVGALGSAFSALAVNTGIASKAMVDLNEINKKANDTYVEEKVRLEQLLKVANDKNASDADRLRATKELQKAIPNGINLINQETIANGKAKKAIDEHCQSLLLLARIEAGKQKLVEIEKERLNSQEDGSDRNLTFWQKFGTAILAANGQTDSAYKSAAEYSEKNAQKFETEFNERTEKVAAMIAKWQSEAKAVMPVPSDDTNNDGGGGGGGDDKNPAKKWSLDSDEQFAIKRIELKKRLFSGEIATEEEHARLLLALEVEALEERIATNNEKGADRLALQTTLANKLYDQQKVEKTRLEKLIEASDSGKTELEKEQIAYNKRLKELGLFNRARETMTEEELAALIAIENGHIKKLSAIHTSELEKEVKQKNSDIQRQITATRAGNVEELLQADTLEKKRQLLLRFYSADKINKIKTNKEAEKLLSESYAREEQQFVATHLGEMLAKYKLMTDEIAKSGSFNGVALNDEDREKLLEIISQLEKKLADAKKTSGKDSLSSIDGEESVKKREKVDLLGMTLGDWDVFIGNVKNGKVELSEVLNVVGAIGNAFGEISKLMNAAENRELKNYERTQTAKRKSLDKRHKAGLISEEAYNSQVSMIDEQTDQKKQELERKQAERAKVLAVFQAIVNTATAVTAALGMKPWGPWSIALAAAVGLMGGVQVAAIMAQPTGLEQGGYVDVQRAQDGKRFTARQDDDARGAISEPTVLVAENGTEYVVPNEGYQNPTIRPVLDIIESARTRGTLREIDLPLAIEQSRQRVAGREQGGTLGSSPSASVTPTAATPMQNSMAEQVIRENTIAVKALIALLNNPLFARIYLGGKDGLAAKLKQFNKNIDEANL